MQRSYRHIKDYEKEVQKLKSEGYTGRNIKNKLGFSYKQMRNYFYRSNVKQREVQEIIAIKCKGRLPKDYIVGEQKYILVRKEAKIKLLNIKIEQMWDFLSNTKRK